MTSELFKNIAPAKSLGIEVCDYAEGTLELRAPLKPNLNDKGTAFAGSIASLLALAGWGVITLLLKEKGIPAKVILVKSEVEYDAPALADMTCRATLSSVEANALLDELTKQQRGRIQLQAHLFSDEVPCAKSKSAYAVILKP